MLGGFCQVLRLLITAFDKLFLMVYYIGGFSEHIVLQGVESENYSQFRQKIHASAPPRQRKISQKSTHHPQGRMFCFLYL